VTGGEAVAHPPASMPVTRPHLPAPWRYRRRRPFRVSAALPLRSDGCRPPHQRAVQVSGSQALQHACGWKVAAPPPRHGYPALGAEFKRARRWAVSTSCPTQRHGVDADRRKPTNQDRQPHVSLEALDAPAAAPTDPLFCPAPSDQRPLHRFPARQHASVSLPASTPTISTPTGVTDHRHVRLDFPQPARL